MKHLIFITVLISFLLNINGQELDVTPLNSSMNKKRPSYFCEPSVGFLAGDNFGGVFHVKNGFNFQNRFDFSLGLGIEGQGYGKSLPVFLESRYGFLSGKTSPFVSVSAGYLHVFPSNFFYFGENTNQMSFTSGAKLGIKHKVSPGVSIVSALGYRYTFMREEFETGPWGFIYYPATYLYNMNRFELSFGLIFK